MGNVFRADSCVKDISTFQTNDVFFAVFSVVHINFAIHHSKHFLAVVDVPFVGLVRPVQAHGGAVHIGDVECAPCAGSGKFGGADGLLCVQHVFSRLYISDGLFPIFLVKTVIRRF